MKWLTTLRAKRCSQDHHVFGRWIFGNKMVCKHCGKVVRDLP